MLFGKFGPWELLIIAFIILVVFGAGKLPNVMRDMGKSIKEFRNAHNEDTKETV
jgi:sec-independent protein translocase protein TatA